MDNENLKLDELSQFLKAANKNTYANNNAKKSKSTRVASEDYHFEQDNLTYHDTYFGNKDFVGEEVVYKNNKPKWGMNYFGFMLDENITDKELGYILKKSLMQEYSDIIPIRGPKTFAENNWLYRVNIDGDLSRFTGVEEILRDNKVVYRLFLHGGMIRNYNLNSLVSR